MSEPIKVGDLVAVIRGNGCHCSKDCDSWLGRIFVVESLGKLETKCYYCRAPFGVRPVANTGQFSLQLNRLKRIPPLDELEGVIVEAHFDEPVTVTFP